LLGTTQTQSVSPAANTYYCYSVTDSAFAPSTQSSATDLVTTSTILTAGPITPSTPAIDNGQTITLSANPSGGTTPYHYQWYQSTSQTCPSGNPLPGTASTLSVSPASNTYYSYTVTDSAYSPVSRCSSGDTVTVNPALVAQTITPSGQTIDSGQSITLTTHTSGGTGALSYLWYSDGSCTTTIAGVAGPVYQAAPTATSTYSYKVTDSAYKPASACSPPATVTVNLPLLSGSITPAIPIIDAGQSINLTSHASGGPSPLSYRWYSAGTC